MDLIHPPSKGDVVEVLRSASADAQRVLIVGGRQHMDKGNPSEIDAELWTTQLDALVSYEPAEMVAVVEAGMRFADLDRILSAGDQEWPADAPGDATVGGIIAAAVTSPRRLRVGALRDTVLEVELVTGDGRLIRGGAKVVKNVTGYDLPRFVAGSLGTLGAVVQVALKVRPRPKSRRTLIWRTDDAIELGLRLLEKVPSPTSVLATSTSVEVRLEGWPDAVAAQTRAAADVSRDLGTTDEGAFPSRAPWLASPIVAEVSAAPSRLQAVLAAHAGSNWGALVGVGIAWIGLDSEEALARLRDEVAVDAIAPVVKGPGGLGASPPAPTVHRRLKAAFDPAGVLAPGRFWGEEA
jgi:glycolate oxidase FAD binding subunit